MKIDLNLQEIICLQEVARGKFNDTGVYEDCMNAGLIIDIYGPELTSLGKQVLKRTSSS